MSNDRILIINLRRFGDIYASANLISSIKVEYPSARIEMLVYKESIKATRNIAHLDDVHFIDRERVVTFKTNDIYSDAFALDAFYQSISNIKMIKWSSVINYSNDIVSSYLTSYLTNGEEHIDFIGIKYINNNVIAQSNSWASLFNNVLTRYKFIPMNFLDCYHEMVGVPFVKNSTKLIMNKNHNKQAKESIQKIKDVQTNGNTSNVKIVGIHLKSSRVDKDIGTDTVKELIDNILDDTSLYPVILIAPNKEEREIASLISQEFDNSLVVIEADFYALPSVLINLDLFVTPDTVVKHIADLTSTPVVEVANNAPFFKQGTIGENNIIITNVDKQRVPAVDIYNMVKCYFNQSLDEVVTLSIGVSMYRIKTDSLGTYPVFCAGAVSSVNEISRLISRQYIMCRFQDGDIFDYSEIYSYSTDEISNWIKKEREAVAHITKDLLSVLRIMHQVKARPEQGNDFIKSLNKVFNHCELDNLIAIPALLFEAEIESLIEKSIDENMRDIELLLYALKNDIRLVVTCIRKLEEFGDKIKNYRMTGVKSSLGEKMDNSKLILTDERDMVL